jgi:glyoxalase family protein
MIVNPSGIHHVTALAGNPAGNVAFYTRVLGLRLVKQTVNFDATHIWHLYYGDTQGSPSTLMTFFPWPGITSGKEGSGLTTKSSFSVPREGIGWWSDRLSKLEIPNTLSDDGQEITFRDSDGMQLSVVATDADARSGWDGVGSIPQEFAVRGLHSVTLSQRVMDPTSDLLVSDLGMTHAKDTDSGATFTMGDGGSGAQVEVLGGVLERGLQAGGTVHHVAFRAPDLATMESWRQELTSRGIAVTEILDRQYFKSIYFREPGGVLFEIATDSPGFDIDEPLLELGKKLRLPPWLEPSREQIADSLPDLGVVDD